LIKRKHDRFVRRLETEFSAEGKNYRGISSDLSRSGLFIRTNHAFPTGTLVDILIHLPDGTSTRLKGNVRRALKTPVVSIKNGMGIELTEKDASYTKFLDTSFPIEEEAGQSSAGTEGPDATGAVMKPDLVEYVIVVCSQCDAGNKVTRSKITVGHACGKCGHPLALQGDLENH
jgi:Tfp pilus assembly protein PilZ